MKSIIRQARFVKTASLTRVPATLRFRPAFRLFSTQTAAEGGNSRLMIESILREAPVLSPNRLDAGGNKARVALRNQIVALRSRGTLQETLVAVISSGFTKQSAAADSNWAERSTLLVAAYLTAAEAAGILALLIKTNGLDRKADALALLKIICTTLWKSTSTNDKAKALVILGSLPLHPVPDYSVQVNEQDPIWEKWQQWNASNSNLREGTVRASEIAAILCDMLGADVDANSLISTVKDITFDRWAPSFMDPELVLHSSSILIAEIIGKINPTPSNKKIGGVITTWNAHVLDFLRNPRNKRYFEVQQAPKRYLSWLTLLIAEVAKRRQLHHHDIFLIKELLDSTLKGWDAQDVDICSALIDSKFSYVDLWKKKLGNFLPW